MAPARATLTTQLSVDVDGGQRVRQVRWEFRCDGDGDGHIKHEMEWRGPHLKLRREVQEAVRRGGRVRTRTLGPAWSDWPDDTRWRQFMTRPSVDWRGLLARMEGHAAEKILTRNPAGGVTEARLAGGGEGWRAELTYQAQPDPRP